MNLSALTGEEKQLLARLADVCRQGESRPAFTHFLNERQLLVARAYVEQTHTQNVMLWGGWQQAERCVLGVFPSFLQPQEDMFPVQALTLTYRASHAQLSHRDFLGAVLKLGVARESVGDILVRPEYCTLFALEPVAALLMQELKKVGGTGVRCETGLRHPPEAAQRFEALRCVVSSMRLDCVVAGLTRLSREKSAALIRSGLLQQNYTVVQDGARVCRPGDVLTIRGYGKFIVDETGPPTKKDRLPVMLRKYI